MESASTSPHPLPPPQTFLPAPSDGITSSSGTTICHHLESLTCSIINSFNSQDFHTPFETFASPDYEYHHRHSSGEVLHLDREGAKKFVEDLVRSKHPQHYADVMSATTHLDSDLDHATVWVSLEVSDGSEERGKVRERVSVYSWRKEGERWVWWTHACADDVPSVPF